MQLIHILEFSSLIGFFCSYFELNKHKFNWRLGKNKYISCPKNGSQDSIMLSYEDLENDLWGH